MGLFRKFVGNTRKPDWRGRIDPGYGYLECGVFRPAFINGRMSESTLLWDLIYKNNCLEENNGKY